jgi:lysophospholipase L1-like esterase
MLLLPRRAVADRGPLAASLLALAVLGSGAAAEAAEEVLVVGDSWGFAAAPALQQVFDAEGLGHVTVINAAVPGETADDLAKVPGLQGISDALAAHPDTVVVHLSIGGNDFLGAWSASLTPAQEDALFDAILDDVDTIVQHVLTLRPDVQLLQPSYDYPRPLPSGTPLEVNTASEELASRLQALADATPGMGFENLNGLMQLHFGFPSLAIPPFDPSLPRLDLPGPEEAFADAIHLTAEGYVLFAEALSDRFYRDILAPPAVPVLSGPAFVLLAALVAGSTWAVRRARKATSTGSRGPTGLPSLDSAEVLDVSDIRSPPTR